MTAAPRPVMSRGPKRSPIWPVGRHMEVEPRITTPYNLEVNHELERRTLETLSVNVDVSTCAIVRMAPGRGPRQTILQSILASVFQNQPSLTIPLRPVAGADGQTTGEPVRKSCRSLPARCMSPRTLNRMWTTWRQTST